MMSLQHVLIFFSILLCFIVIALVSEFIYWRERDAAKLSSPLLIACNIVLGFSYKSIDILAVWFLIGPVYDYISPHGLAWFPELNLWTGVVIYLMVDLSFYVTHFIMHKVRWFWTGHVTHHSSTEYNFSTALRQNFTVVLNGAIWIWWLPVALIGLDRDLVLLMMEANLLYQFLLHTQMPSPLDRLGAVFNTPSHHRVHHGNQPLQIDTNFGGTLIIWDKLFGTFTPESQAGKIEYGLTRDQPDSVNPVYLISHEWCAMLKDFLSGKGVRALYSMQDAAAEKKLGERHP